MTLQVLCHICSGQLSEIPLIEPLKQVTSDCRPWENLSSLFICANCGIVQKQVDEKWEEEMNRLYMHYKIYAQSNGQEQKISFTEKNTSGKARSEILVEFLFSSGNLGDSGKLIDIGCGNGSFLRAFRSSNYTWKLNGLELDDKYQSEVESIPDTRFFSNTITEVNELYDLAVMVHTLEHLPNPISFLESVSSILYENGLLLIEVPNFEKSPFDILIADHCSHFTPESLRKIVEYAGFIVHKLEIDYVAKEITLLAQKKNTKKNLYSPSKNLKTDEEEKNRMILQQHLELLNDIVQVAQKIEGKFGIFGSSISATWLAIEMSKKVAFFIDEDSSRIGGLHVGLPIISPSSCPKDIHVLFPLRRDIAEIILSRFDYNRFWITL